MTTAFEFEDPGEGIHEAEVLEILVSAGDQVKEGQDLVVVETDKTSFELASPRGGTVADVVVSEGDTVQVGDTLLHYESDEDDTTSDSESSRGGAAARQKSGEDSGAPQSEEGSGAASARGEASDEDAAREDSPQAREASSSDDEQEQAPASDPQRASASKKRNRRDDGGPVLATPATRKLARELDVDLREVEPSGEEGRVLNEDVRAHHEAQGDGKARGARQGEQGQAESKPRASSTRSSSDEPPDNEDRDRFGPVERVQLRSIRRRTAQRMAESWQKVARVTHQDEVDVTELERLRQRLAPALADEGVDLSLTVMVLKAVTAVLRDYPRFNASLEENDTLVLKRYVNLGVAVDTEQGLLVPVVRDAASKSLRALAGELEALSSTARAGKLRREQVSGGTFTVSNVGPIGGTGFTPLVNYPETAILGLGRARLAQVVEGTLDDHETRVRLMLPLSLSYDHRVIDGAEGARFARSLAALLGDPDRFVASV